MTDLSEGKFVTVTAIDNVVAHEKDQGEAPIGPQPDFVAVMGNDSSILSLVCEPGINSFSELTEKNLSNSA